MNNLAPPQKINNHYGLWLLPIGMLLLALLDLPYGYYTLLRFIVCGCCGYLAYTEYAEKQKATLWVISFSGIALLFNPIIPIHLNREIWTIIDPAVAVVLIVHFIQELRKKTT